MEKKRKIIYIANARIPTEKAHGIQIMKMCEAFAKNGAEIDLILPRRFNKIKQDPFEYYGVERVFKIKKIPSLDLLFINIPLTFFIQTLTFLISAFFYLIFQKDNYIIYTRGETILGLSKFCSRPLFWETHIEPKHFSWYKKAIDKIKGLIVVTTAYRDFLVENHYIPARKILYAPDGVDVKKFDLNITKEEARKKLDIKLDLNLVLYTGSFLKWKGVDVLQEVARKIQNQKSKIQFIFVSQRPYSEMPIWLKAADILVLTGTLKNRISRFYTSPLKMFEYMASNRPIIAPRIPSFLDILNDNNSFLIEPDNPHALKEKIYFVLENPKKAELISNNAYEDSSKYDWNKRAERILEFIKNQ